MRSTALARVMLSGCVACAAACAGPATQAPPPSAGAPLPALSDKRVEAMRAVAPELAELIVRLHALAEEAKARGDENLSRELAMLAQVNLLTVLEWKTEAEAQSAGDAPDPPTTEQATAQSVNASAEADAPVPDETQAPPPESAAVPPTDSEHQPSRSRGRTTVSAPKKQPDEPPASEATATVSDRLAALAERLARAEKKASSADRPTLDRMQTVLIEADRVLAEGLEQRAEELAKEAAALLASLDGRGSAARSDAATDSDGALKRDARQRLGDRAVVRGNHISVRIDDLVHFDGTAWQARDAGTLNQLRALVRGYRSVPLNLVTLGEPKSEALEHKQSELRAYLAERFQIPPARLKWTDSTKSGGPTGTYLLFVLAP